MTTQIQQQSQTVIVISKDSQDIRSYLVVAQRKDSRARSARALKLAVKIAESAIKQLEHKNEEQADTYFRETF
jgi:hypothetical protein